MRSRGLTGWVGHGAVSQLLAHGGEPGLVRIAGGEGQPDPAGADAHHGGQFEDTGAERAALRLGPTGAGQSQAAQAVQQQAGKGRQLQAQLVGAQGGRAGTVGKQARLLRLDAIFQLPAHAV